MRGYSASDKARYWLASGGIPVTKSLIVVNVLTLLLVTLFHLDSLWRLLVFDSSSVFAQPWTMFTYPLVGLEILSLLFAGYWLWVAGGSLERTWGSNTYAVFFFVISAITAVGLYLGGLLTHSAVGLVGLWMPLAALTVAFAMLNPEQRILFFFVIPLKLKYLALLDVVLVFISYGRVNLLLGVFALAGCAAAYLYVTRVICFDFGGGDNVIHIRPKHAVRQSWNPFKRAKEKKDQKRLRDFLDDD